MAFVKASKHVARSRCSMKNRGSSSADINPGIVLIWESCLPPFCGILCYCYVVLPGGMLLRLD